MFCDLDEFTKYSLSSFPYHTTSILCTPIYKCNIHNRGLISLKLLKLFEKPFYLTFLRLMIPTFKTNIVYYFIVRTKILHLEKNTNRFQCYFNNAYRSYFSNLMRPHKAFTCLVSLSNCVRDCLIFLQV